MSIVDFPDFYLSLGPSYMLFISFYLEGPNWRISASLPHAIQVGLGDHVVLEMEADKPYIHYDEHKHKYPPGQFKNKHKKVNNKKNKKFG